MNALPPALQVVLERARRAGMLGPDEVATQVAHALEFLAPFAVTGGARCVDLGSGAGVPGLPLALAHPSTRWALVDAWESRCDQLERAVRALALQDRVEVVHSRAEDLGHGDRRGAADIVVARSFGPPAATAEAAGPLVIDGGRLVVSVARRESRWPDRIESVALELERDWSTDVGAFRAYRRRGPISGRFPRRPSAQRRSPLF